ncbi:hypothetical protein [Streptomyces sp. NBC_00620]|uniref:hypothetical protein n=1 Tax=Streptomyces sp. NBC_00620 TaxID=2903666 RepID=UPI00224D2C4A|nr:hypothetical protein [Streptomyces sp. NBC_00620]MCX4974260.1 hypothetical protein [Streptomyces sp. NBC_00620]
MTDTDEPIRKSLLPCTPPPEWEFHSVFGAPSGCMLLPSDAGPVVVRRRVSYGDWEPVRPDHWAEETTSDAHPAAPAVPSAPADRAALREQIAETMARADGWEWAAANFSSLSTPTSDRYRKLADAVLAVLPADAGRATVLAEVIARVEAMRGYPGFVLPEEIVAELRRVADEAQPTTRNPSVITDRVLSEVLAERIRQDGEWGEQNHPDGTGGYEARRIAEDAQRNCQAAAERGTVTWLLIADEEHCEALAESDPAKLRAELIQDAAVKVAWIEAIDRRAAVAEEPT